MRNICVIGIGSYLPQRVVTNDELAKTVNTTDEWIHTKTGIRQRYVAADHEATSDLALVAANRALVSAGLAPGDLDLIVLATSSPDMLQPSTAAILQGKLGAVRAGAFDVSAVCAGFVYGFNTACSMMRGCDDYRHILVVGAETYSRILDWNDRSTCVFFGDGAGAVVLGGGTRPGFVGQLLQCDGKQWEVIQFPAGGSRMPTTQHTLDRGMHSFRMDGKKVWDFAVQVFPDSVRMVLDRAGYKLADLDLVISHQANINIIKAGMAELGLPMEKTFTTIETTANTSGASIPIALDHAWCAGRLKPGNLVCLVGFGGGLAWGASLFRWTKEV